MTRAVMIINITSFQTTAIREPCISLINQLRGSLVSLVARLAYVYERKKERKREGEKERTRKGGGDAACGTRAHLG